MSKHIVILKNRGDWDIMIEDLIIGYIQEVNEHGIRFYRGIFIDRNKKQYISDIFPTHSESVDYVVNLHKHYQL